MPCAAVELCQILDLTPEPYEGHGCRGGCGGRLHTICGDAEQEGDSELQRICPMYASKQSTKAASTAAAGKRIAQAAGGTPKRQEVGAGKDANRSAPRTRLNLAQKAELLAELYTGNSRNVSRPV